MWIVVDEQVGGLATGMKQFFCTIFPLLALPSRALISRRDFGLFAIGPTPSPTTSGQCSACSPFVGLCSPWSLPLNCLGWRGEGICSQSLAATQWLGDRRLTMLSYYLFSARRITHNQLSHVTEGMDCSVASSLTLKRRKRGPFSPT